MSKTKHPHIDNAVETALRRVELCKLRRRALELAVQGLQRDQYRWDGRLRDAFGALYDALHREAVDAYEAAFMWGLVSGEDAERVRKLAFRDFLKEDHALMGHLDPDGVCPGMYLALDEEEFRAEIEALRKEAGVDEEDR